MAKALQVALKNYREHMQDRKRPACFPEEDWAAWTIHEAEIPTLPIRRFACRDCTHVYQKEMRIQGRCANPFVDLTKIVD